MPIDINLFRDDATPAEHRSAQHALGTLTRRGLLEGDDRLHLLDALPGASAAARLRIADALRSTFGVLDPAFGEAVAESARREPGNDERLLALLLIAQSAGSMASVDAPTLLRLRTPDLFGHRKLPSLLEGWCEAHDDIPLEIVDWAETCSTHGEHPNLERLRAWLAPTAARMLDVAAWEAGAGEVDDMDHDGFATVRRAVDRHGDVARVALAAALLLEAPGETRTILLRWQAALEAR